MEFEDFRHAVCVPLLNYELLSDNQRFTFIFQKETGLQEKPVEPVIAEIISPKVRNMRTEDRSANTYTVANQNIESSTLECLISIVRNGDSAQLREVLESSDMRIKWVELAVEL